MSWHRILVMESDHQIQNANVRMDHVLAIGVIALLATLEFCVTVVV